MNSVNTAESIASARPANEADVSAPPDRRLLLLLEVATVLVLVLVAAAFARPLAEEWGFIEYWNAHGLGGYPGLAKTFFLRPLMPIPFALEWLLGGGSPLGFGMGFAALIVAKYVAARWAVTPILNGPARWAVATMAAVLLAWPAEWQPRYSETQISTVFLLVGLGAALRVVNRFSLTWLLVGGAAITLMLGSYQALVLCALAIPLVTLFVPPFRQVDQSSGRWVVRRFALTGAPVVLGLIGYATYAYAARQVVGSSSYEENLLSSGNALRSLPGVSSAVSDLYHTAYLDSSFGITLMLSVLVILVGPALLALPSDRERLLNTGVLAAAVVILPLLALPYSVDAFRRVDPDRVFFPVAVGFVLLSVAALARFQAVLIWRPGRLWAALLVVPLLLSTGIDASVRFRDFQVEDRVLQQTAKLATEKGATSVVVRDFSGTLGDVFVYHPVFQQALSARGTPVEAIICTPLGVDRVHPVARRLGFTSTPRCEETPTASGALTLDARLNREGNFELVPGVNESPTHVTPEAGFDVRESLGSRFWWWMTEPQGAIRVSGKPSSVVVVSMSLSSPPCGAAKVRLDGKLLDVTGLLPVEVPVTIGQSGSGTLAVSAMGKACTPKKSPRSLYVAVNNPATVQK